MKICYTDGSCRGNPGPGGYGAIVLETWDILDHAIPINATAERSPSTTNNREEMKAIIWVMRNYGKDFPMPIVYSDSAYCVNSFTLWLDGWRRNGWVRAGNKPLENKDLIQEYDRLWQEGYRIDLHKVPGHAGIQWNEVADALATERMTIEEALKLG